MTRPVLELRPEGLYCPAGDFHIDPWRPVRRAVTTALCGLPNDDGSLRYVGDAIVPPFLGAWLTDAARSGRGNLLELSIRAVALRATVSHSGETSSSLVGIVEGNVSGTSTATSAQ